MVRQVYNLPVVDLSFFESSSSVRIIFRKKFWRTSTFEYSGFQLGCPPKRFTFCCSLLCKSVKFFGLLCLLRRSVLNRIILEKSICKSQPDLKKFSAAYWNIKFTNRLVLKQIFVNVSYFQLQFFQWETKSSIKNLPSKNYFSAHFTH